MFGRTRHSTPATCKANRAMEKMTWDVPVFFGIMFVLSIAELVFTIDSFQFKQRKKLWQSGTERARLAFLIFSSVRTIALSAVYVGFHFARKYFHSIFHTVFLVLSTIFWIVSGVLIHTMWGFIQCGGVGELQGGLSECHELEIIEYIAFAIAAVSIVATIPVVMNAMKRRKRQAELHKTAVSG